VLPKMKYSNSELLVSGLYKNVTASITTTATISSAAFVYSKIAVGVMPSPGLRVTPQVQYDYNAKEIQVFRTDVDKSFSWFFLNVSYEKNVAVRGGTWSVGLRTDLDQLQGAFSLR